MRKYLLSLILLIGSFNTFSSQEVLLGSGEWPPYAGKKLKGFGFLNDVVSTAFYQEGITATFDFKPWARVEIETVRGEFLASPGWSDQEGRKDKFIFSEKPIIVDRTVFIQLIDNKFDWKVLSDLKKFTIGSNRADYYVEALTNLGVKVQELNKYPQGIKMLFAKRFDALIVNESVGKKLIRDLSPQEQAKIKIHALPYDENLSFLVFSKNYPNVESFVEKYNSGFDKIQNSGLYQIMLHDLHQGKYD
ncbi:substrate-binding periplasmic protein [Pseudoalteromonas tunicata]|uniref:substrate-binding periplasmic protein n=1 Tax=Pseudoalteromonas tunicata TaxID=314281 RepID=UPI00273F7977|nr:transporter substrate-binding domain-containing protein [Pseudoalteromonas tunicata]MDP4983785.1 transporter substrate-binding domain-containing protein [Pseudoalteromonas tunicata]MDP5215447.1 transporter substrate-binding domain-containing protein [Pseudoalteromonas tunicata]